MKLTLSLALLAAAVAGLVGATPTPSAAEDALDIVNLRAVDAPESGEITKRAGVYNGATLQAWTVNVGCPGTPGFTWFPVGYSTFNEGPSPCYEYWDNNQRRGVRSLMLTGNWGPTCAMRSYTSAGCSGGFTSTVAGTCRNYNGNNPWLSFRVHCA